VIATLSENSDILASAYGDRGGTANINALQVVGLRSQPRITPDQLKALRENGISDTNASFNTDLERIVADNTQDTESSQELAELIVTSLREPSNLIATGCEPTSDTTANRQSEFVVTGRGGLPPGPDDPQTSGAMPPGWVTRDVGNVSHLAEPVELPFTRPTNTLVEAQGMFINAKGELVLTAQTPTATPHQSGFSTKLCPPASNSR
jgi:large exoprotein involved in heme utilization and adhesion